MKKEKILCAMGLAGLLFSGCAQKQDSTAYIGAAEARQLALADAGLADTEVEAITADLNSGTGSDYYQVEFTAGGKSYEYGIDAHTGVVIKAYSSNAAQGEGTAAAPADQVNDIGRQSGAVTDTQPSGVVGTDNTAGEPSGTGADSAASQKANTGTGSAVGETTNATPGSAVSKNPNTVPGSTESEKINADEAKTSALTHAGLTSDQVVFQKSKLDYEDGRQVYDVEFYTKDYSHEYDYEIDAYTGEVISYDHDVEHQHHGSTAQNGTITAEKAKEIALAKVPGAAAGDIREFETDYDDGRTEYEGKIIYGGIEYEFEIDAGSGAILSWESEPVGH